MTLTGELSTHLTQENLTDTGTSISTAYSLVFRQAFLLVPQSILLIAVNIFTAVLFVCEISCSSRGKK